MAAFIAVGASAVARTSISASELLTMLPRGAYTTARTINRTSVFEFETHVQRTAASAAIMQTDVPRGDAASDCASASSLRPHMLANIACALRAYWAACDDAASVSHEVKLSTLLTWSPDAVATLQRVAASVADPRDVSSFSSTLSPSVGASPPPSFMLITHAVRLGARRDPPIRVVFLGHPRQHALAKDSEWIRARKPLEAFKSPDVEEVILVDDAGDSPLALEGTQTNFFAVKDGVIHTAGEGVLEGTVRRLVLEVARRDGIPVEVSAPRMNDLHAWEGAFISSTSRLVLPIDELIVPAREDGSIPEVRRVLPPCGLVQRLEAAVAAEVAAHSTRLL